MENGIMKFSRIKLFLLFSLIALLGVANTAMLQAQVQDEIELTGTIVDDEGLSVIGASIVIKGEARGTASDMDGYFRLKAPANAKLVISYIGYATQEIAVAGRNSFNIVLKEDAALLGEVVVIGYGAVKKGDLTGSIVSIKADEINRGAVTSPQELLQGKVPGLFVEPSTGQPGGSATIRIRSGASLNASNDPLIVVDGVPIGHDAAPGMANILASINPNDIENFTVLKDASATAIYGSRASNGVILITTKRGGKEPYKVSYNSTYSIVNPYKKVSTLGASQYRELVSDVYADNAAVLNLLNMYPDQSTNWQDEIFRTAFGTDQNLSVAGTIQDTQYRVSLGYNHEDGTLKTSNYKRYTLDTSFGRKFLDDHLSVSLNLKGVINKNKFVDDKVIAAAAFYDPTKPVYNLADDWNAGRDEPGRYNGYWNWESQNGGPHRESGVNPMQMLRDKFDTGYTRRSIGNIQLDYKLHWLPELKLNLNLAYDIAKGRGDKGPNIGSFDAYKDNQFQKIGRRESWDNFRRSQLLEAYVNYDKELPSIMSRLGVMGGYSWQHFYFTDYTKHTSPFLPGSIVPDVEGWNTDRENGNYVRQNDYRKPKEYYLASFFGRFNYVFHERYMLTATVRRDGSSRFAKDYRWGTFPSVALAWTVSEESFLRELDWLSNLKLRLGWGETGQQHMGDDFYTYINNYLVGSNINSQYLDQYPMKPLEYNPELKWETTTTYNVAMDYGFWNNRINGSLELYKKKTEDLLSIVNIPAGTNFKNRMWQNVGTMENKGVEFNVNAVVLDTKDWGLNLGFNATWNVSEITKLNQRGDSDYAIEVGSIEAGTNTKIQQHKVGYAPYTFFLYEQVYDEHGKPIQNALVDRDNDGQITAADRYMGKSPAPKWYMGFSSSLRYQQWDLGFNLRANLGNYSFNELAASNASIAGASGGLGVLSNLHSSVTKTGFRMNSETSQVVSDLFVENASFLKMDNITLGYSFKNFLDTSLGGRLSFSVQNVFTITEYDGLDPENSGIDGGMWPRPRTFTFGLNLNF